jgi:hypothetical protein
MVTIVCYERLPKNATYPHICCRHVHRLCPVHSWYCPGSSFTTNLNNLFNLTSDMTLLKRLRDEAREEYEKEDVEKLIARLQQTL